MIVIIIVSVGGSLCLFIVILLSYCYIKKNKKNKKSVYISKDGNVTVALGKVTSDSNLPRIGGLGQHSVGHSGNTGNSSYEGFEQRESEVTVIANRNTNVNTQENREYNTQINTQMNTMQQMSDIKNTQNQTYFKLIYLCVTFCFLFCFFFCSFYFFFFVAFLVFAAFFQCEIR